MNDDTGCGSLMYVGAELVLFAMVLLQVSLND
jgi:hypothetical protein